MQWLFIEIINVTISLVSNSYLFNNAYSLNRIVVTVLLSANTNSQNFFNGLYPYNHLVWIISEMKVVQNNL